jgi:hypothetical protein
VARKREQLTEEEELVRLGRERQGKLEALGFTQHDAL